MIDAMALADAIAGLKQNGKRRYIFALEGAERDLIIAALRTTAQPAVTTEAEPYPSPEAMKAAVEMEIMSALGSVQTVAIGRLIQKAIAALPAANMAGDVRAHKVMTPEEYAAMPICGWHEVCRDVDGFGGTGIRFLGVTATLTSVHDYVADYEFRGDGGDYKPTDHENELIEDAIEGYLTLSTPTPAPAVSGDVRKKAVEVILSAIQSKRGSDDYGVSHALKMNRELAEKAASTILALSSAPAGGTGERVIKAIRKQKCCMGMADDAECECLVLQKTPGGVRDELIARADKYLNTGSGGTAAPVELKKTYIKSLRTIVEIDARFADRIRDLLNVASLPKTVPELGKVDRAFLRKLVDIVWNEATESTVVPSTNWADRLIERARAALQQAPETK